MLNISKEDFVRMIDKLQRYVDESSALSTTLSVISNKDFNYGSADALMYAVVYLLTKLINSDIDDYNEQYDGDIECYLFEQGARCVIINDKEFIIDTPEALYDYIEYKRTIKQRYFQ